MCDTHPAFPSSSHVRSPLTPLRDTGPRLSSILLFSQSFFIIGYRAGSERVNPAPVRHCSTRILFNAVFSSRIGILPSVARSPVGTVQLYLCTLLADDLT